MVSGPFTRVIPLYLALFLCSTCSHAASSTEKLQWEAVKRTAEEDIRDGHILRDQTNQPFIPAEFIITDDTVRSILETVATARGEILFTTLRLPFRKFTAELDMIKNFCYYLDKVNAIQNTIILTTDNTTWSRLHELGMPVYLDKIFPERKEYVYGAGKAPGTPNRVFDVQKHWWGYTIIRLGFRAAYMDADAVPLQDPFLPFEREAYDVQGLSDWSTAKLPTPGSVLSGGCGLYYWIRDPSVPKIETILREFWMFPNPVVKLHAHNPCQSTGVWYLLPTGPAIEFMRTMSQRLFTVKHQWDQTAWNEVILPFLWGAGDEAVQLRYRLLPHKSYANVGVYELRKKEGLPVDLVVLHSGGLHGLEKAEAYERLGYWHPDLWTANNITAIRAKQRAAATAAQQSEGGSMLRANAATAEFVPVAVSLRLAQQNSGFVKGIVSGLFILAGVAGLLLIQARRRKVLRLRSLPRRQHSTKPGSEHPI